MWTCKHDYIASEDAYVSRLFFFPKGDKSVGVESFFKSHADPWVACVLAHTFPVIKNGEKFEINLNKPRFIAEYIKFMLAQKVNFVEQKRYRFDNAWDILIEMGFDPESLKTEYKFWSALENGEVSKEPIIKMLSVPAQA